MILHGFKNAMTFGYDDKEVALKQLLLKDSKAVQMMSGAAQSSHGSSVFLRLGYENCVDAYTDDFDREAEHRAIEKRDEDWEASKPIKSLLIHKFLYLYEQCLQEFQRIGTLRRVPTQSNFDAMSTTSKSRGGMQASPLNMSSSFVLDESLMQSQNLRSALLDVQQDLANRQAQ